MAKPNVIGLMIGKKNSVGVPRKNTSIVLGKRLCEYPLIEAKKSGVISKFFVSTDCPIIKEIGWKYKCGIIHRSDNISDPDTLTEDVLYHAHQEIKKRVSKKIDYYSLLYANGGFVTSEFISESVNKLECNPGFDSCVGVIRADMFTPTRCRRIAEDGEVIPYNESIDFGNSNRDSTGGSYFIDHSCVTVKSECFEKMDGAPPMLWLGPKILSLEKDFGGDIDDYWMYPVLEYWLKNKSYIKENTNTLFNHPQG